MNSQKRRIVIIGGFGWCDIGDEAMPQTVIYQHAGAAFREEINWN